MPPPPPPPPNAVARAIAERFERVTADIERWRAQYGRAPGAVQLIAVGKLHTADKVAKLAKLGQRDFAENYAQEGVEKIARVAEQLTGRAAPDSADLRWHFIGHIQSRKCRQVAAHFDWVHSVDSIKVARRLSGSRLGSAPLNVLIQVNLQGEASKHGVAEAELPGLAAAVAELPNLRLRGLMLLPAAEPSPAKQRAVFARCRAIRDELNARGLALDHLSMGMSGDLESAIAEGATMVRVGTALFGPRPTARD